MLRHNTRVRIIKSTAQMAGIASRFFNVSAVMQNPYEYGMQASNSALGTAVAAVDKSCIGSNANASDCMLLSESVGRLRAQNYLLRHAAASAPAPAPAARSGLALLNTQLPSPARASASSESAGTVLAALATLGSSATA